MHFNKSFLHSSTQVLSPASRMGSSSASLTVLPIDDLPRRLRGSAHFNHLPSTGIFIRSTISGINAAKSIPESTPSVCIWYPLQGITHNVKQKFLDKYGLYAYSAPKRGKAGAKDTISQVLPYLSNITYEELTSVLSRMTTLGRAIYNTDVQESEERFRQHLRDDPIVFETEFGRVQSAPDASFLVSTNEGIGRAAGHYVGLQFEANKLCEASSESARTWQSEGEGVVESGLAAASFEPTTTVPSQVEYDCSWYSSGFGF